MKRSIFRSILIFGLLLAGPARLVPAAQAPQRKEEKNAYLEAAERVRAQVVRIDTIGGKERVGRELAGGPASGLLLDADGHVLTSGFHLRHEPSAISVRLPDGSHAAAKVVAVDHSNNLVLLKINRPYDFSPPVTAALESLRVGQWVVALGQALSPDAPNLSVGILSAKNRVWGKALQTDAAVGPNNYGGPLIDLEGRILGLLTPLSPMDEGSAAGYEWYDSGIGMAVPIERALEAAERMRSGNDLREGRAGLRLPVKEQFIREAEILQVLPDSPADRAGVEKGDRITAIDERPISLAVQALAALRSRYEGDRIELTVEREGKSKVFELVLEASDGPTGRNFQFRQESSGSLKK